LPAAPAVRARFGDLRPLAGFRTNDRGAVPKDKAMANALRGVHVMLNFTLLALVCTHGAAALKHHFVDRDAVLIRMLPRSWDL